MKNNCPKFTLNLADEIKDTMWYFLQTGRQKASIPALKDAVRTLINATVQKTAGQKPYAKATHVDWSELDMVLWTIAMEAVCLVLSGKLDEVEDAENND